MPCLQKSVQIKLETTLFRSREATNTHTKAKEVNSRIPEICEDGASWFEGAQAQLDLIDKPNQKLSLSLSRTTHGNVITEKLKNSQKFQKF